jgi:hypothetical protein
LACQGVQGHAEEDQEEMEMGEIQGLEFRTPPGADRVTMRVRAAPGKWERPCDHDQLEGLVASGILRNVADVQGEWRF